MSDLSRVDDVPDWVREPAVKTGRRGRPVGVWKNRRSNAAYYVELAWDRRQALIRQLGGKCARCGAEDNLEFDHPRGRPWNMGSKNQMSRMTQYQRDADAGNLQLLCKPCNARDGAARRWGRKWA